jgi:hypothetical protein
MNSIPSGRRLEFRNVGKFVDREYRSCQRHQYARELLDNSIAAGATKVLFGMEFQAAERLGIFRRLVADNGSGMSEEAMLRLYESLGESTKLIDGPHDNFGIGSRITLLPWNTAGMVVISYVDYEARMMRIRRGPDGEYELVRHDAGDGPMDVYPPHDDPESGCDWREVWPLLKGEPVIDQGHGTIIVLLGTPEHPDTILGEFRNGTEDSLKAVVGFLNRRFFTLPEGLHVCVRELANHDRSLWPRTEAQADESQDGDVYMNPRQVQGALYHILGAGGKQGGSVAACGEFSIPDGLGFNGLKFLWWLWDGPRPKISGYADENGFISVLYKNELYGTRKDGALYRSFGIPDTELSKRLTIVVVPRHWEACTRTGIYPSSTRDQLDYQLNGEKKAEFPLSTCAGLFSDHMPPELEAAIRARETRMDAAEQDAKKRTAVQEYGERWGIPPATGKKTHQGPITPDPEGPLLLVPTRSLKEAASPGSGGPTGTKPATAPVRRMGRTGGTLRSGYRRVASSEDFPSWDVRSGDQFGSDLDAVQWTKRSPAYPGGLISVNRDNGVVSDHVAHLQHRFNERYWEWIEAEVYDYFGFHTATYAADLQGHRARLTEQQIEERLSSSHLTAAIMGRVCHEQNLLRRIRARIKESDTRSETAAPGVPV